MFATHQSRISRPIILTLLMLSFLATFAAAGSFEQDRKAILAMAGAYKVKFDFRETIALKPGYKLHEGHTSDAVEWVVVAEDTGRRIVLQHLLVDDNHVVKHWTQQWSYENRDLLEFKGHDTWQRRTISADQAAGTWTQGVFQVDDSPRYESFGRWVHRPDLVYWESAETWRPLPRREHTTRSDYDVLVTRNRHTLTPAGWLHEQDSHKLILPKTGQAETILVRELGFNTYDKTSDADIAPAVKWWTENAPFWKDVRAVWADIYAQHPFIHLLDRVNDRTLPKSLADCIKDLKQQPQYGPTTARQRITSTILPFLKSEPPQAANR